MTLQAVLWDLDGTLADTEELHFRAWYDTMSALSIPYTYADFIAGFGKNNASLLPGLLGDEATPEQIAQVSYDKEANFRALLEESDLWLLPGVATWLQAAKSAKLLQAVASSGPMINIAATIHKLGIGDYFHALLTGAPLPKGKPDPTLFLHAAASIGITPEHCLVIEDSIHGIEAAQRAGMVSIAVGELATNGLLNTIPNQLHMPRYMPAQSLEALSLEQFMK